MKNVFFIFLTIILTEFIFVSNLGSFPEIKITSVSVPLPKVGDEALTKWILAKVTAYGPPNFPEGQATYSGEPVGHGSVAGNLNDPNIPLYSHLRIEGFKEEFVFHDTGVEAGCLDVWLPTAKEVDDFGIQWLWVEVLKDKSP